MDPFAVLGVDEDADSEEIERAYRKRLKEAHPDGGGSREEFERVRDAFQAVTGDDKAADAPEGITESGSDATSGETDPHEYIERRDQKVPADRDAEVDTPGTDETESSKLRAVGVGIGVGVGGLVLGVVLTIAAALLVGLFVEIGSLELLVLSLLMTQGVGLTTAAAGYVTWRGAGIDYIKARVPGLTDLVWVVVAYVSAIVGVWVVALLATLADAPTAQNQVSETASRNPDILLLLIPGSFLLIGPGEELLFRGIVQARIREAFGAVSGVVIASVIFAAVHFVALTGGTSGRLVTVGILLVPSLILGAAYEYTDNIVVPALIHGAYNATLFAILYAVLKYGDGLPSGAVLF